MSFYKNFPLLVLSIFLSSCGFHPLYHTPCQGSDVSYPIKIETISDREGQLLRNYLLDLLTPEGVPLKPKYFLEIKLTDTIVNTGIRKDETTSRKKITVVAALLLKDSNRKVVYSHAVQVINSFNVKGGNYYADLVGAEYGRKEALRVLSEKIKIIISAYLDKQNEN